MSVTVPCCKTNFTESKHIMLGCTLSWLFNKCCLVVSVFIMHRLLCTVVIILDVSTMTVHILSYTP